MPSDLKAIESNVNRARDALRQHFMDPGTKLIYDYRDPHRDINLPTADEIAREIPNAAGWATGFEDTAIAGGALLDGLVRGWKLSDNTALAGQARMIWQGLRTLGTAGSGRGFVCRGVLPSDGKSHYPNSSGDQYTLFCAGIYGYFHSDLAAAEDRTLIARLAVDIRDHVMNAGMRILREDGKPSIFGDVGRKTMVDGHEIKFAGPGVLQYLALAADTTGDIARKFGCEVIVEPNRENLNVNKNVNKNENKIDIDIENSQTQTQNVTLGARVAAVPTTLPATGPSSLALSLMAGAIPPGLFLRK